MSVRERLKQFIDYKGISKYKFYKDLGLSNGFLDKDGNIGSDKCEKIIYQYPELNILWLITGQGEMLQYPSSAKVNNIIKGNGNQVAGGNMGVGNVSITMPESGIQKIIRPTGEIEIQRTEPAIKDDVRLVELSKTIELLQQRITLMEDNIKIKDDLIASLKENIELLRHK